MSKQEKKENLKASKLRPSSIVETTFLKPVKMKSTVKSGQFVCGVGDF